MVIYMYLLVEVDLDDGEVDLLRFDVERAISTRTKYLKVVVDVDGVSLIEGAVRIPRRRMVVTNQLLLRVE